MTVNEFVKERIKQVFLDVAEMVSSGEIEADVSPLTIMVAQSHLLGCWQKFTEREAERDPVR